MIILMNMIKEMKMITLNKIVKSEQIVIAGIVIVLLKRISSEKYDYGDRINCVFSIVLKKKERIFYRYLHKIING